MSVVSPKTVAAREEVERIFTRHAVGQMSMAEAVHAVWRIVNDLTATYDEGYNHGYRACEEEHSTVRQQQSEPPYKELP